MIATSRATWRRTRDPSPRRGLGLRPPRTGLSTAEDFGFRRRGLGIGPIGIAREFEEAVALATTVLLRLKAKYLEVIAAEEFFVSSYAQSPDPRYVVLDRYIPHGSIASKQPELLFTVFPGATGNWTIQTVRPEKSQFGNRKDLPAAWRGLNGAELTEVTGVPDAVFCHKAAFIAAAQSEQGARAMLALALA